mmetsp:Transcript_35276/g.75150  ORF Transcript_35276/g.75150 Transcript_35276/m.75150 type:complete len:220 (+) Transcript_35276:239-898(+)|eukprot:CAMPEP_0206584638 /NCGR_PEP_ID=MMETSP0325_2-20121206/35870_1 /ASSEMBLY_ACC=CAM_ASM_000347 /TAXON_ID=2866 /ORGANISM="Crypthecodinium cohnii, Strain Seligo" /LENGTH=219 /DNA_ID=CAMNT_0054091891 /DNA_START=160 /DNA_END=819 /DNA_ORIENTATION=+
MTATLPAATASTSSSSSMSLSSLAMAVPSTSISSLSSLSSQLQIPQLLYSSLNTPRPLSAIFAAVAVFELGQSVRHVLLPDIALGKEEASTFFPSVLVKSLDSEAMRRVFAVAYGSYLATLAGLRIAYATSPPSLALWSTAFLAQLVETGFWWCLEIEEGVADISAMSSPKLRRTVRKRHLFLIAPFTKKTLLAGPPLLAALLLVTLPQYLKSVRAVAK